MYLSVTALVGIGRYLENLTRPDRTPCEGAAVARGRAEVPAVTRVARNGNRPGRGGQMPGVHIGRQATDTHGELRVEQRSQARQRFGDLGLSMISACGGGPQTLLGPADRRA